MQNRVVAREHFLLGFAEVRQNLPELLVRDIRLVVKQRPVVDDQYVFLRHHRRRAERKLLCIEPEGSWTDSPLCCVRLDCRALPGAALPTHRDYLGSLMGLELKREALGDIVLPPDAPGTAYVFALEPAAKLICQELCQAGRTDLSTTPIEPDALPAFPQAERTLQTATVSSLRLDAVLAAMLRCSRGAAAELVTAGRVEINHLPAESVHAPVYEGDVFTVRGKGRFGLTALPGKSKKDRSIIEFFQYE